MEDALRRYILSLIHQFTPPVQKLPSFYWAEPKYTVEGIEQQRAQVEAHDERMLALAFIIAMNEDPE